MEKFVPLGSWDGRDSIPLVDEWRRSAGSRGDDVQRVIRWRVAGGRAKRSTAALEPLSLVRISPGELLSRVGEKARLGRWLIASAAAADVPAEMAHGGAAL